MTEVAAAPADAEVVQADTTASEATQATESTSAVDPAEAERREQDKAKARENAAFAALRQQLRETREEAARERAERQALAERLMPKQSVDTSESGPPDPSKYAGGEFNPEFIRDMARHEARQAFRAEREAADRQAREAQQRQNAAQAAQAWKSSEAEAMKKYGDFEVIVEAAAAQIPQQAKMLMVGLKDGAELLYHAAKNPDLAKGLSGSPVEIAAALGELRAEVRYQAKLAAEAAKKDDKPINPGNAGGRSGGEPDPSVDVDKWIAWRRKQLKR